RRNRRSYCLESPKLTLECQRREGTVARFDRKYFNKKFKGLLETEMGFIALRAAMRGFPVLAQRGRATHEAGEAFWFWAAEHRARYTLFIQSAGVFSL